MWFLGWCQVFWRIFLVLSIRYAPVSDESPILVTLGGFEQI